MRKPKVGDWRIMQSADGSEFWIERYEYGGYSIWAGKRWRSLPFEAPGVFPTLDAAKDRLELLIRGPQVRLAVDEKGRPV